MAVSRGSLPGGQQIDADCLIRLVTDWKDSAIAAVLPDFELIENEPEDKTWERRVDYLKQAEKLITVKVKEDTAELLESLVSSLNVAFVLEQLNTKLSFVSNGDESVKMFTLKLKSLLNYAHLPLTNYLLDNFGRNLSINTLFSWLMQRIDFYKNLEFLTQDKDSVLKILRSKNFALIKQITDASCLLDVNPWFSLVINLEDYSGAEPSILAILQNENFDLLGYLGRGHSKAFRDLECVQAHKEVGHFLAKKQLFSDDLGVRISIDDASYRESRSSRGSRDSNDGFRRTFGSFSSPRRPGSPGKSGLKFARAIDAKPAAYRAAAFCNKEFVRILLEELHQDYLDKIDKTPLGQDNHRMIIKNHFVECLLENLDMLWCIDSHQELSFLEVFNSTYIPWYIKQTKHLAAATTVQTILERPEVNGEYKRIPLKDLPVIFASSGDGDKSQNPLAFWWSEVFYGSALITMISRLPLYVREKILLASQQYLPEEAIALLQSDYDRMDMVKNEIVKQNLIYKGQDGSGEKRRNSITESARKVVTKFCDHGRREHLKIGILNFLEKNWSALWRGDYKSKNPPMIKIILEHYIPEKINLYSEYLALVERENMERQLVAVKRAVLQWQLDNPGRKLEGDFYEIKFQEFQSHEVTARQFQNLFILNKTTNDVDKSIDALGALTIEALKSKDKTLEKLLRMLPRYVLQILFKGVNIDLESFKVILTEPVAKPEYLSSIEMAVQRRSARLEASAALKAPADFLSVLSNNQVNREQQNIANGATVHSAKDISPGSK